MSRVRTPMPQAARTAITLGVAGLLVLTAAVWGWSAMTTPFPGTEDTPPCVDTTVKAGNEIFRDQLVVSVFNGSARNGLAGLTLEQLTDRGFVAGRTGNAPRRTKATLVHARRAGDPAARLVAAQFHKARIVKSEGLGVGVAVVVGPEFKGLRKNAPESVKAKDDTTICAVPGAD